MNLCFDAASTAAITPRHFDIGLLVPQVRTSRRSEVPPIARVKPAPRLNVSTRNDAWAVDAHKDIRCDSAAVVGDDETGIAVLIGPAPGPANLPATEFIDGTLFSTGMPPHLRHLTHVARFQDKTAHLTAEAAFDERARYAFTPFSEGSKRYRGPAVKGHEKVRCPNAPASMSKTHLPLTNCRPGQPCSCARTVTLNNHPRPELIQHFAWGTSDWEADYGRRSLIESVNAGLKTHFAGLNRGSIRVMGRAKVTLAFGILCAVMNMRLIRERYGDLLELSGTVEPLPSKGRKPFRSRYKSIANPRAERGRAPTAPLPATMVAPAVARTHE